MIKVNKEFEIENLFMVFKGIFINKVKVIIVILLLNKFFFFIRVCNCLFVFNFFNKVIIEMGFVVDKLVLIKKAIVKGMLVKKFKL